MNKPSSHSGGPALQPVNGETSIAAHLAKRSDNFLLLRIFAALAVIYGHSFALTKPGNLGDIFVRNGWPMYSGDMAVAMFFVISGYMVSGSYLARGDLWEFTKARLLRIVPAFALVLAVCAYGIGPLLSNQPMGDYFRDPAVAAYAWKNLRFSSDMAWQLPGVFQGQMRDAVNGSIWTLPAEMRMYVLTAALGVFGLLTQRWLGTACMLLLVVLGITRPEYIPLHPDWFRLAGFFAVGILVQLHKDRLHVRHTAMLMLLLLVYLSMRSRAMPWLFALALAYFCFWFAYRTPVWRKLEQWGDPSYGIYLWGWPLQQVLVAKMPAISAWHNFALAAVLATCMGYVSWWCLERPALKLKHWHPRRLGTGASIRTKPPGDGLP